MKNAESAKETSDLKTN